MVQDRGNVLSPVDGPARDQPWQKDFGIVMVGFSESKCTREGPETIGVDDGVSLAVSESGVADQRDPASVLCGGRNGLVLRSELGDAGCSVVFRADGLVDRQLRSHMGEDPLEDLCPSDLSADGSW